MATQQREKNGTGIGATIADSAKDVASKTGSAVQGAASTVAQKAQGAASTVAQKAADAGGYIAHKAEDATSAVGGEMKSLGGTIRDRGPHDGMLGNASSAVAGTLETCGRELQEHGLSGIADDVTNTVRRHPVPAILIGVGVGFLLARVFAK